VTVIDADPNKNVVEWTKLPGSGAGRLTALRRPRETGRRASSTGGMNALRPTPRTGSPQTRPACCERLAAAKVDPMKNSRR
jgi:hypothetical protein